MAMVGAPVRIGDVPEPIPMPNWTVKEKELVPVTTSPKKETVKV